MSTRAKTNWKTFAGLLFIAFVVFLFWNTLLVYPLRILVVFFHEMSHGAAALLTGGRVHHIYVGAGEGGLTVTQGGNRFLILSAGYMGSMLIGGLILAVTARSPRPGAVSVLLGLTLLAVSLIFVRPLFSFGFFYGLFAGGFLVVWGTRLSGSANEFLLKVIGLSSCMYAIVDILNDVMRDHGRPSDAVQLAEATGIPAILWGVLWLATTAVASYHFLTIACRERPPRY